MNLENYLTPENLYLSTFVLCFISGFVPLVNAEAVVIAAAAFSGQEMILEIAIISAFGQMIAKGILYFAGRGVLNIPMGKYEAKLAEVEQKFERWRGKSDLFIFLSASVGFPPFYVVSILAGVVKHNFYRFFLFGMAGRTIRFGLLALFPHLLRSSVF